MLALKNNFIVTTLIFILSVGFYSYHLGVHGPEYRDDEVFYYQSTKQMSETGDWLSPKYFDDHRFQKPILFYWFIGLSYQVFGVTWFAARFPSAVMAGLTLVLTWLMAKELFSRRVAFLSTAILWTTPLFWRHAKNAVPDMSLNFFVVLSIYLTLLLLRNPKETKYDILFFVSCGLGFMIKGFVAILTPLFTMTIYALWAKDRTIFRSLKWWRGIGIMLAIILPWFIYMIYTHGHTYLHYMITVETADRLVNVNQDNVFFNQCKAFFEHFVFYIMIIVHYMVPWIFFALFVIPLLIFGKKEESDQKGCRLLIGWTLSMMIFFSFIYFTIGHYMLVITTPLAILLSYGMFELQKKNTWIARSERAFLFVLSSLFFLALSLYGLFVVEIPSFFAYVFIALYVVFVIVSLYKPHFSKSVTLLFIILLIGKIQAPSFAQQGLTPHASYQKFADIIQQESSDYIVGMGSHELHEKELQVFFNEPVGKYANDHEGWTHHNLGKLMRHESTVFCLMIKEDYEKYIQEKYPEAEIIHTEKMYRKNIPLGAELGHALRTLDQNKVRQLLKHDVVLLRREYHDRSL